MAVLHFSWGNSRCTRCNLHVPDTGQETTEEHRCEYIPSTWPVASTGAQVAVCVCVQPSDIDQLSNDEILELRNKSRKLHPNSDVVKVTPSTIARASQGLDEDAVDASRPMHLTSCSQRRLFPSHASAALSNSSGISGSS